MGGRRSTSMPLLAVRRSPTLLSRYHPMPCHSKPTPATHWTDVFHAVPARQIPTLAALPGLPATARLVLALVLTLAALAKATAAEVTPEMQPAATEIFARSNLVAWCIVPFDAQKNSRSPASSRPGQ